MEQPAFHGSRWAQLVSARGWLYSYDDHLADARVNRSERLVLYAGKQQKIGWFSRKWGGRLLTVVGRRTDGSGSFRQRFRATVGVGWYPSGLRIPEAGYWKLTLRTEGWVRQLVAEAIEPPTEATCDSTPVPASGPVLLTPRRSRSLQAGDRGERPTEVRFSMPAVELRTVETRRCSGARYETRASHRGTWPSSARSWMGTAPSAKSSQRSPLGGTARRSSMPRTQAAGS